MAKQCLCPNIKKTKTLIQKLEESMKHNLTRCCKNSNNYSDIFCSDNEQNTSIIQDYLKDLKCKNGVLPFEHSTFDFDELKLEIRTKNNEIFHIEDSTYCIGNKLSNELNWTLYTCSAPCNGKKPCIR